MVNEKHLILVWCHPPSDGIGIFIVLKRHLSRLSNNGWDISIIAPDYSFNDIELENSWNIIKLPFRKWWWPPYRKSNKMLLKMRLFCFYLHCRNKLKINKKTCILTSIPSNNILYPLFANFLSYIHKKPLFTFLFDQMELYEKREKNIDQSKNFIIKILNSSKVVWTVSENLKQIYKDDNNEKNIKILYPIPHGGIGQFKSWNDSFSVNPKIIYSGYVYESQVKHLEDVSNALKRVNGTLEIITNITSESLKRLIDLQDNVKHNNYFNSNEDSLNYLYNNASLILVIHPLNLDNEPWLNTSFPSKLIEYSHLGFPIIIISRDDTSLGVWAKENSWKAHLTNKNYKEMEKLFESLTKKTEWEDMSKDSVRLAKSLFNPNNIHNQFQSDIEAAFKN